MISRFKSLYYRHQTSISQLIKFGIVGFIGTAIDVGFLNLLHQVFEVMVYLAATISFILAVINNFVLNKYWTFKDKKAYLAKSHVQFFQFIFVSVIGLLINLGLMYLLIEYFGFWYNWAKLGAIIVVLFWNFFANKFWTFRKARPVREDLEK
ncbi:MAG: GtrA family protein [Patescibacteria group bacterium]|nr:GtrA family protein [Patescibacteria group bacterium]